MYHQNLGSRRFNHLTFELLYETPRQFAAPLSPGGFKNPRDARPSFTGRSASRGSSRSVSSGGSISLRSKRKSSKSHAPMPTNATSRIAAAAAFAEEKDRMEREQRLAAEELERERGRRKERVSNATTINGEGLVQEIGVDELKKEAIMGHGHASPRTVEFEVPADAAEQAARNRKSSATLSIVLNEFENQMQAGERTRAAEDDVEDYTENVSSRIPNVPYKSVTHPDVAQPRDDAMYGDRALVKPTWKKQPLEKISAKTQKMKQKIDDRTTSMREKIPFFRNGSTMDRIKETFKFSRFTSRH
ncbi:hypothetical protein H072_8395 [Dactylellina haptotyla CBS 200.50]|uniref:Uncharacterized protein n=1 Tax=Dactylellina haptotyla (strain CBS 200.50) TaxID=1284197 RepID=S8A4F5_DACHA|nr:hypothetical protein H072_8395 [Dactylellina haptotyla CBS 200.50]